LCQAIETFGGNPCEGYVIGFWTEMPLITEKMPLGELFATFARVRDTFERMKDYG
jgi:hypothetical protein